MHTLSRHPLATACVLAAVCLALRTPAQQPAAAPLPELEPLVISDGQHQGEVDLTVDLDSTGTVAKAFASSSDKLAVIAATYAKMLRHPVQAGDSGLQQRVLFLRGHDVKTVAPVYPALARQAHVGGLVRMIAAVGADGHVNDVTLLSGHPLLVNSARESLLQWLFPPIDQAGTPVAYHAFVDITFNLR